MQDGGSNLALTAMEKKEKEMGKRISFVEFVESWSQTKISVEKYVIL